MILLIDNYDSFSYNLYQLIGEINPDIKVIRNDEMSVDEIRKLAPERIILSPGPGRPEDAGIIVEAARELGPEIPLLGVCLGHQAICTAFGADVTYARELMHGRQSVAQLDRNTPLFDGLPEEDSRCPLPLPRRRRADDPGVPENHCRHSRRGSDGRSARDVSHIRRTVSPRIDPDPGRTEDPGEFPLPRNAEAPDKHAEAT